MFDSDSQMKVFFPFCVCEAFGFPSFIISPHCQHMPDADFIGDDVIKMFTGIRQKRKKPDVRH